MEWECPACTLLNQPDHSECLACGQARPDKLPPMGSLDAASLPPTAGGGSRDSLLPPHGTQNFGSGTLPPQGTLSPNAMADLMPSPQRSPQSVSDAFGRAGYDEPKKSKKQKERLEDRLSDLGGGPELVGDLEPRGEVRRRGSEMEHAPTYVATGGRNDTLQGSLAGSTVRVRILRAYDLRNTDLGILPSDASDPFAVARLGWKDFKTHVVENSKGLRRPEASFRAF